MINNEALVANGAFPQLMIATTLAHKLTTGLLKNPDKILVEAGH